MIELYDYQVDALRRMKNGCILNGGVGSGKSRTSLAYYFLLEGGKLDGYGVQPKKFEHSLYIITTAHKRDTHEWDDECMVYGLDKHKVIIDSWNNIGKYVNVEFAFFIFDEDRVTGNGKWVKSFLKIVKANRWIILSATPGDTWMDYIPVFIANGFYRNRTDFNNQHVIFSRWCKFPKVEKYVGTGKLMALRKSVLVNMNFERHTTPHHIYIDCLYNAEAYRRLFKARWNDEKACPIASASELCYELRKCVNVDSTRLQRVLDIVAERYKVIIFYNYDYELELLRKLDYGERTVVAEWNGHQHDPLPVGNRWVYLVQYTAGAEGWNCTSTNTIIFYSQNYSYKVMVQSAGRIDRLNTPFDDLYYYHLRSKAPIDMAIKRALNSKKKFNETAFVGKFEEKQKRRDDECQK